MVEVLGSQQRIFAMDSVEILSYKNQISARQKNDPHKPDPNAGIYNIARTPTHPADRIWVDLDIPVSGTSYLPNDQRCELLSLVSVSEQ